MICTQCGAEILDTAKFCPYCGNVNTPAAPIEEKQEKGKEEKLKKEKAKKEKPKKEKPKKEKPQKEKAEAEKVRKEKPAKVNKADDDKMHMFPTVLVSILMGVFILVLILLVTLSLMIQSSVNAGAFLDNPRIAVEIKEIAAVCSPVLTVVLFVLTTILFIVLAQMTHRVKATIITGSVCFLLSGGMIFSISYIKDWLSGLIPLAGEMKLAVVAILNEFAFDGALTFGLSLIAIGLALMFVFTLMNLFGGKKEVQAND